MSERRFPGRDPGSMRMIENIYSQVPAFNDLFDEETFYTFVMLFVAGTILIAYISSKYITIKPVEWFQYCSELNKHTTKAIFVYFSELFILLNRILTSEH